MFTILLRVYIYAIYVWKIISLKYSARLARQKSLWWSKFSMIFSNIVIPMALISVGHRKNHSSQIYAPNDWLLFHLDGYADRNDHEVHKNVFFHHFCSALE